MPTENEKTENLVDVGEADQQETEVNLDDKGEPEKVETPVEEKIEVEQVPEDKDKFDEPWCKKGEWVIFARYAGSRLPIDGGEVRLLNDDEVLATIDKPEDILHTF